jgi:peroxiredoxin
MRFPIALALTAALFAGSAWAAPKVGQPAPAFTATDSRGNSVSLAEQRGKFVVLEWTNDGCPFVQKHYRSGNMQALQQAARADGAVWLTVISSAPGKQGHVTGAAADALTEAHKASPTAVLLDESGTVGRAYDARTTPQMFIVDPQGTLIYAGGIDSIPSADTEDIARAKPYVRTALAEAMAGKPVTDAVTKPYGCSVKY